MEHTSTSFNLLGPLVVTVAGVPARLGGPRQSAVLARLLLHPGTVVSMDQLAEGVWDGEIPARPEVAIRSYISNLRRSIEPQRSPGDRRTCIESVAPGYRLTARADQVDHLRFETLVAGGRQALADADPGLAESRLGAALELWRGEPCEGLAETDVVMAFRARLAELRLVAAELWAEARLAQGEHDAVAPDLEVLVADHPRRERLVGLLMVALYRAGRQSEALVACQRLRHHLLDQLGIDPGPAIQDLEHRILSQDPALLGEHRTRPVLRVDSGAVPAAGGPPGVSPEPAPPGADLGSLVGRSRELTLLAGLEVAIDQGRSAVGLLIGEPGSGKTVLLDRTADRARSAGMAVAWGRCRDVARHQVLWPWQQIFQSLVPGRGLDAGTGSQVATDAAARFPDLVAELRGLALQRPILIVVDDAHWADEASLELLAFAADALVDDRVAFAVAWRTSGTIRPAVRRGLRALSRLQSVIRIELGGLDPSAVAELLARSGPGAGAAGPIAPTLLARAVHAVTAGNPLFVRAVLDDLMVDLTPDGPEAACAGTGSSGCSLDDVVRQILLRPPSRLLQELVTDRVEQVHPLAGAALTVGALLDRPFPPDLVADAARLPPEDVDDAFDAAVEAGLLVESAPDSRLYRLVHPLVARVLEFGPSGPRRGRLHAALGHALWRSGGGADELAHHFALAGSVGTDLLAARFALDGLRTSAPITLVVETGMLVARGLDALDQLPGSEGLEVELAVVGAQVARLQGDVESQRALAARAVAAARRSGDPDHLAAAVLGASGSHPAGPPFASLGWDGTAAGTGAGDDGSRDDTVEWRDSNPWAGGEGPGGSWLQDLLAAEGPNLSPGWARLASLRLARLLGAPRPDGGPESGLQGGSDLITRAHWREEALAAFDQARASSQLELVRRAPTAIGPAPLAHDWLLAQRLGLVAGIVPPPGDGVSLPGSESPAGPSARPRVHPGPGSLAELDAALTSVTFALSAGRLALASTALQELAAFCRRTGLAPGPISAQQLLLAWELGSLATTGETLSPKPERVGWRALVEADTDPAVAWATLDGVGAGPHLGLAQYCLLIAAAHHIGHSGALQALGRSLHPADRSPVVSDLAGLVVLGPTAYFAALAAGAMAQPERASHLLDEAEALCRHHRALTWLVRVLAARSELALAADRRDEAGRHRSEAGKLAATIGCGWFDRWLTRPGLQSRSNPFAIH